MKVEGALGGWSRMATPLRRVEEEVVVIFTERKRRVQVKRTEVRGNIDALYRC